MSKPSSSRLTASKKNRPRPPRRAAACPDSDRLDSLHNHCWQLGTLAELLEACGQPLEPATVEGIGQAIRRDVEAMKALLNQLEATR